jgi:signal transduction histidine kinase
MVEELLDFSRMSSGRLKLNIEKIDILAELDEVVFAFRDRAVRSGIEILYNVPQVPAPTTADASRMRQVFINVLDNAVKYSEHGDKITVLAEMPNPSTLVVTFSDTGIGISADDLPHIKEKFYKVDSTVRGSGIGLAVVDEIIKLHNGELEVTSVHGEGTTVKITLPLTPAESSAELLNQPEGDRPDNEQGKKEE